MALSMDARGMVAVALAGIPLVGMASNPLTSPCPPGTTVVEWVVSSWSSTLHFSLVLAQFPCPQQVLACWEVYSLPTLSMMLTMIVTMPVLMTLTCNLLGTMHNMCTSTNFSFTRG